jgi:hypothetical protein
MKYLNKIKNDMKYIKKFESFSINEEYEAFIDSDPRLKELVKKIDEIREADIRSNGQSNDPMDNYGNQNYGSDHQNFYPTSIHLESVLDEWKKINPNFSLMNAATKAFVSQILPNFFEKNK